MADETNPAGGETPADKGAAPPPPPAPAAAAKALVLPKAAADAITQAVGQAIEALSAILDMAKSAQASDDPAAVVPPEFAEQIERVGMMVAALGDQYETGGGMDMSGAPAAAPEEMALAKSVGKALAVKALSSCAKIAKGKVKMDFKQALKIHGGLMSKLYDIANELAPMLNEFGASSDVAAAIMGPPPAAEDAPATKAAPGSPDAAAAGAGAVAGAGERDEATARALKRLENGMDGLGKTVSKIAKMRPEPTASPDVVAGPPPPAPAVIPYGKNLSKAYRESQQTPPAGK